LSGAARKGSKDGLILGEEERGAARKGSKDEEN
jgi:hypothetical protein